MKITRKQLKQLIKEELSVIDEASESQPLPVGNVLRSQIREHTRALYELYSKIVDIKAGPDGPFTRYSDDVWPSPEDKKDLDDHFKANQGPQTGDDHGKIINTLLLIADVTRK
jgi:hypothetical protein